MRHPRPTTGKKMPDAAPSALLDLVQFLRDSQDTVGLVKSVKRCSVSFSY